MEQDIKTLLQENKKLVQENIALAQENNKRIKHVERVIKQNFVAKIIYWIIIILITLGAFAVLQPTVKKAANSYQTVVEGIKKTEDGISNAEGLIENGLNPNNLFDVRFIRSIFQKEE